MTYKRLTYIPSSVGAPLVQANYLLVEPEDGGPLIQSAPVDSPVPLSSINHPTKPGSQDST